MVTSDGRSRHARAADPDGCLNAEGLGPRARNQASRRAVIKSSLRRWLHWHSLLQPYGQSPRPYVHASPPLG